ncbi:MAG: hypothetical protein NTZ97_03255 [Candidatus Moranbacteria bacterium]|nr:hypothetical protein [Candidatus Moranbacteria bacterium]
MKKIIAIVIIILVLIIGFFSFFGRESSRFNAYHSEGECMRQTLQPCSFKMCDVGNCASDTGWYKANPKGGINLVGVLKSIFK